MDKLRAEVNAILAQMIAEGHDVYENCDDWSDEEVMDFHANYSDDYSDYDTSPAGSWF